MKQSLNSGTWDPYSHPPADVTQIYTDALEWSPLPCSVVATTEIEFGHQTTTLPNLCSSDSVVRFRRMHGLCWQIISAGCSLFTWDASVRSSLSGQDLVTSINQILQEKQKHSSSQDVDDYLIIFAQKSLIPIRINIG